MGGLLKFLLITICVLYMLRVLARVFLPFLFKKAINKMQEKMHKQYGGGASGGGFQYREYHFGGQPRNNTNQPEGKITVDYIPPSEKKKPNLDKGGEFVEFEEVKK